MSNTKGSSKENTSFMSLSDKNSPKARGITNLLKERNLNTESNEDFLKIYK